MSTQGWTWSVKFSPGLETFLPASSVKPHTNYHKMTRVTECPIMRAGKFQAALLTLRLGDGYNVMTVDSDTIPFDDLYGALKTPPYSGECPGMGPTQR